MTDPVFIITTLAADGGLDNNIDPTAHAGITTVQVASLLIGFFLPILASLVTKQSWSAGIKSIVLLALSAITGFLTEFVNSADFVWQQALLTSVMTFVVGVATYYGLWHPTGVSTKAGNTLVKDRP